MSRQIVIVRKDETLYKVIVFDKKGVLETTFHTIIDLPEKVVDYALSLEKVLDL